MEEEIKLSYTLKPEDYRKLISILVRRKNHTARYLIMFLLGAALTVMSFWYVFRSEAGLFGKIAFPLMAVLLTVLNGYRYFCTDMQAETMLRNVDKQGGVNRNYWKEHNLSVQGNRLLLKYGSEAQTALCSSVRFEEHEDLWIVWTENRPFDLIPKTSCGRDEISEFRMSLTENA